MIEPSGGSADLSVAGCQQVEGERIGIRVGAVEDLPVAVAVVFEAHQQGVAKRAGLELAREVELEVEIGPAQVAVLEGAPQGPAVAQYVHGTHAVAEQTAPERLRTRGDHPVRIEPVLDAELAERVVVANRRDAGFADEAVARQGAQVAIDGHDAAVEGRRGAEQLALERDRGIGRRLPGDDRRDVVAIAVHEVAETAVVLDRAGNAGEHVAVLVERAGGVEGAALLIETPVLGSEREGPFGQRLLGDDVEGAARIAAAVQEGRGSLQDLDPLDRDDVGGVRIAPVDREAVAEILAGGEAADRELAQAEAGEVVRAADTGEVQGRVDARRCCVGEHLIGHDHDSLRNLAQGRVGARRADAVPGEIAVHGDARTAGPRDRQLVELHLLGGVGGKLRPRRTRSQTAQGAGLGREDDSR